MRKAFALGIVGLAAGAAGQVAPLYWPDTPAWVWGTIFWAGIAVIVFAIVWGCWPSGNAPTKPESRWFWAWKLSIQKEDAWPLLRLIPLKVAAQRAYDGTPGTLVEKMAEHPFSDSPAQPLPFYASHMTSAREVGLYGRKPHSQRFGPVGHDMVAQGKFIDDLSSLVGRHSGERLYDDLCVKASDVRAYIKAERVRK